MIKATYTAIITVFLTVFLAPLAEITYNNIYNQENNDKHKPRIYGASTQSSVLKNLMGYVWSEEYPEEVRCIVGEAEDQLFDGQVAVGEAIRNRGSLKGVYGCTAKRTYSASDVVWKRANRAWVRSQYTNLVKGADHWHSDREPEAWWEKYGVFTVKIGSHKFYKEVYR